MSADPVPDRIVHVVNGTVDRVRRGCDRLMVRRYVRLGVSPHDGRSVQNGGAIAARAECVRVLGERTAGLVDRQINQAIQSVVGVRRADTIR